MAISKTDFEQTSVKKTYEALVNLLDNLGVGVSYDEAHKCLVVANRLALRPDARKQVNSLVTLLSAFLADTLPGAFKSEDVNFRVIGGVKPGNFGFATGVKKEGRGAA